MDGAKPFVTQERDGAQAENLIEGAVQGSPRNIQVRADFGNVHGPKAGGVQIFVDFPDQLRRRGQRSSGVRWERMHDGSGYGVHDRPLPEISDGVGYGGLLP